MDICLCKDQNCPLKNDCYRFTAEFYGRQSFFASSPFEENTCEYFKSNEFQIARNAYYLWLSEGCQEGKSEEYWLLAKAQLVKTDSK